MKHLLSILFIACVCVGSFAQTPYDSFAPETSRPMLELPEQKPSPDTLFCAIVADMSNQTLLLVEVSSREIIATAPITDDLRKWLSVDPLSDKYPGISPYAYAAWNPIKYVDPDGRKITITGEDGITITYVPGENYEGNNGFTKDTYTKLNQLNDMFSNTDFMSSIVNSHDIYNISSKESMVEGTHSFKDGVINIGTTCSIDGIGHELFHAYQETKGQGGASIHNEVEAYLFQTKIRFILNQGNGSTPLTAAEKQASSTFTNALNSLIYDGFNQHAFNAVVSEFKSASNANNSGLYNKFPLVRNNQTQSLIKQFYPIYP